MNIDGQHVDRPSTPVEFNSDRRVSSSELLLAEVLSYQQSQATIGRRREPNVLEFSNPLRTSSTETSSADRPGNYIRELAPNGRQVLRDRVGLEVQVVGDVSPAFQERMLRQIQALPEADRRLLAAAGVRVMIAGEVPDANPSIANDAPRNWPSGTTQADTDGAYLERQRIVVVAERTRSGPTNRADGVLRHEVGHALNDALGNISETREFVQAYLQDLSRMSRTHHELTDYLRRPGRAGRDEAFADIYAALRGGVPNQELTRQILQAFPRVTELVRRRLGR